MFIPSGAYQFGSKRVAFRNDYCLTCRRERRSVQIRAFYIVYFFWIPVVPLGFWKRWVCKECNNPTDTNKKSTKGFKWGVLIMLILAGGTAWAFPLSASDSVVGSWLFRIGAPLLVLLILVHLIRAPKEPSRKDILKTVPAASESICPFCGTQLLVLGSHCSCPTCGILRV